jgi:hypothetical protein
MTNTQQLDADWTAPLRKLIASLRDLEARFNSTAETIRQHRPDEEIGDFPSMEGIETMSSGDLGTRECFAKLAVRVIEQRAEQLVAEAEQAERMRAESLCRQNMCPLEAQVEALKRAVAYQLRGVQSGSLPGLPHVARAVTPQMLGLPGGMGRHPVSQTAGSGVRKIGTNGSVSGPDGAGAGFARKVHPLELIGGGGRW